jgi:hypothetical protein
MRGFSFQSAAASTMVLNDWPGALHCSQIQLQKCISQQMWQRRKYPFEGGGIVSHGRSATLRLC